MILVWLLSAGIFFTLYFRFLNFTHFLKALRIAFGKENSQAHKGEVSHFQALSTALSGTLGLGNISGVAIAISLGGPGATVWMIFAGLIGMCSKFTECTLGVKYRVINENGSVSGGPMYYLSRGFAKRGWPKLGKLLAGFFCVMCIGGALGAGNMFQSNQAASQLSQVFFAKSSFIQSNVWVIGLFMAVAVGIVIIGGITVIGRVAGILVPFMCAVYFLAGLIIIFFHYKDIPDAILSILNGAINPSAIKGGIAGVILQGLQRASFSNEAGIGSAPIAHSAVKTDEPISQGMVGLLEPFIDTVVICTMTAIIIVISKTYIGNDLDGIAITSAAFAQVISWFPNVLAIGVLLFAYSTMISWSYYGSKSWNYLFGESRSSDLSFKFIFCTFTIIGTSMTLDNVVIFSDAMLFAMAIPNIIGLYVMSAEVKTDLIVFLKKN